MTNMLLMLLTAHLLGDFIFQTKEMVEQKRISRKVLIKHSAIITLTGLVLTASLNPTLHIAVFVSHLVIDQTKLSKLGDDFKGFFLDQSLHISILILIAYYARNIVCPTTISIPQYKSILIVVSSFIICVKVGEILVEKLTRPLSKEIVKSDDNGLTNGGKLIGMLERAIVFILVLFGQPVAIGFIFTAKSILRFGEIKDYGQRKEAEYIIIGTFASFGWAFLVALSTAKILTI